MGAVLLWNVGNGSPPVGALSFDATLSETPTFTATATEHPVETGANVSDHVRTNLDALDLEVFVSNTPTDGVNRVDGTFPRGVMLPVSLDIPVYTPPLNNLTKLIAAGLNLLFPKVTDPPAAMLLQFPQAFSATGETLGVLRQLMTSATLLEVISRDWDLSNMVITSVSEPRTPDEGDGAKFTIQLKQIRIVETRQTVEPIATEPRGKGITGAGAQGGKKVDAPKAKASSVAYGLLNGTGKSLLPGGLDL